MLELPIEVEVDTTHVLYPDAEDIETIVNKKRGEEYIIGRLQNGRCCIKSITYRAGYGISALSAGRAVHIIRENEKLLDSLMED